MFKTTGFKMSALSLASWTSLAVATTAWAGNLGNGTSGGGNASSEQLRQMEIYLRDDSRILRNNVKAFAMQLQKFPNRGKRMEEIDAMYKLGLLEDIDKSPYVPSKLCEEDVVENGVTKKERKDASTIRGERNAPICIDYERLASKLTVGDKGNMEIQLTALMLHEHARHFGYEDTTNLGLHPLSGYLLDRFEMLDAGSIAHEMTFPGSRAESLKFLEEFWAKQAAKESNGLLSALTRGGGRIRFLADSTLYVKDAIYVSQKNHMDSSLTEYSIYSSDPASASMVVSSITGDCGENPIQDYNTKEEYPLAVGTAIPLKRSYVLQQKSRYFGIGSASDDCRVEWTLRSPYGEVKIPDVNRFNGSFIAIFNVYGLDLGDGRPFSKKPLPLSREKNDRR